MKIADDFLEVCLNLDNEVQKIEKDLKTKDPDEYRYWGRDAAKHELKKRLFILTEEDFTKAITLCKEFKRSIQKKAYEFKLNKFEETGEYVGEYGRRDGFTYQFIDDLRNELYGRRGNHDRNMLVNASVKEIFPEANQMRCAAYLFDFCARTKDYEITYEKAQETLLDHQSKINKIHDLEEEGKSVMEIVGVLTEMEED